MSAAVGFHRWRPSISPVSPRSLRMSEEEGVDAMTMIRLDGAT